MTKKILFVSTLLLLFVMQRMVAVNSQEVVNQLIHNAHGGVEILNVNGASSYFVYAGTGYMHYFYEKKAYVKPEIDFKYGEYSARGSSNSVKTSSVAIPVTVGYHVFQESAIGMNIFGGVRYEYIFHSDFGKNYDGPGINNNQVGLTLGTSVRLISRFSINASYYYGLTPLYKGGERVTSFSFSFNF